MLFAKKTLASLETSEVIVSRGDDEGSFSQARRDEESAMYKVVTSN
jgi:hypothetical protein